ncbi:MAG: M50 family metallopeptidase [Planctomycetota bacterium]
MTDHAPPSADSGVAELAAKLRGVSVRLRQDLEVTRHVFQQTPTYLVRDPVTFGTYRFSVEDYAALAVIDTEETLGQAFETLVQAGNYEPHEEEDFYALVLYLHRASLLNLPFSDHAALFKRYERRRRAKRLATAMSPFFFRVPVWNPDRFLDRTHRLVDWIFSGPAFIAWAVLIVSAGIVGLVRRDDLTTPLLSVLEIENLPLLWVILVVLKVFHEFGHAYACKRFGGKVPDMGAMFIVGTPAAYVDASAAWGFRSVRQRMIVNLAGVYFESIFAAIALFVWAATPPGLLNTAAYQTLLMASIVTLGFNINPFAKFDGYYVVADLSGIPNLRQRANERLVALFNRVALGLPQPPSGFGPVSSAGLVLYAIGVATYRVTVILGLSAVIATKMFLVGLGLAVIFILTTVYSSVSKAARYLIFSETTAPVRRRAVLAGVVATVTLVTTLFTVPIRRSLRLDGIVVRQTERTVHATTDGFVRNTPPHPKLAGSTPADLVILENADATDAHTLAVAELRLAHLSAAVADDPVAQTTAMTRLAHAQVAEKRAAERLGEASLSLNPGETLLGYTREIAQGEFMIAGEPIAYVGSGGWVVDAFAKAEDVAAIDLQPGDTVECRSSLDPTRPIRATFIRTSPAADRNITRETLTQAAGGPILIDSNSQEAREPYVRFTFLLGSPRHVIHGATAWVDLPAKPTSPAAAIVRNIRRFTDDLSTR